MNKHLQKTIVILSFIAIFLILHFSNVFYPADMLICDHIYKKLENQSRMIKIIAVDEKTEAAYGKFENWSREKSADLIELLSASPEIAPSVVAFDVMFIGTSDPAIDARLAEACKHAGNVVCASDLVFTGLMEEDDSGELVYNPAAIEREERPFDALDDVVKVGFTNACISEDNIIRFAKIYAESDEEVFESFAYTVYLAYAKEAGLTVSQPKTQDGQIGFFYSGEPGDIPHVSLVDVLEGRVPLSEFDDAIVFVGVYAAGFQDAYHTSVARGEQMHGVEINANIVLALMNGKLANPISSVLYAFMISLVIAIWTFFIDRQKIWLAIAEAVILIGAHLLVGKLLASVGYLIPQISVIIVIILTVLYLIIRKYTIEKVERRHTLQTMKKYVAPQIVDMLSKDGKFELHLGGEKRHIAVLFVDVRGFTTMSEILSPEEVVNILNQYLSITTEAVFSNEGTLDKFIGDATMAVFNAPFDLEDYIFKAVKTAWDIREGVAILASSLEKQYHRAFSVGIGINCGEAVVGNIGCEVRMDYTAIGDTVNTAARLESNAKAGTILISQAVYDVVAERVIADPIGELTLKGKQEKVPVYSVKGFVTLHSTETE